MKIDDGISNQINNNSIIINTTSWSGGENHTFLFDTTAWGELIYLNFVSNLIFNFTKIAPNGATAIYSINSGNSERGVWNITYDNSFSYAKLILLNSTSFFNLSSYSISYINMPAFDMNGANSGNWEVFSSMSPSYLNTSQNLIHFNYTSDPCKLTKIIILSIANLIHLSLISQSLLIV